LAMMNSDTMRREYPYSTVRKRSKILFSRNFVSPSLLAPVTGAVLGQREIGAN